MPKVDQQEKQQREAAFAKLYQELNDGQRQAVDLIEGPVMVLAGPGTGKTQTLTMRIANILLQTQMDPWNVLCLTFTESGVNAMRERLFSIIGTPAYYVKIHTFHSFCNDIIQDNPEYFAKARQWQPLTDVECIELLQDVIDILPGTSALKPFGNPYLFLRDIGDAISKLKQEDYSPESFKEITKQIAAFVKEVKKDVADFHALKPKERTDAIAEKLYKKLEKAGKEAKIPAAIQDIARSMYEEYQSEVTAAEDGKTASKIRTAFKNDIKRWVDRLDRDVPKHTDIAKVYKKYQEQLQKRGRYDYEDMIVEVLNAWREHPDLLADSQEKFQYILVDEYQDTNGSQNEVVRMLGSFDENPNIFVVGDDKQSIYRFQGASINNMLDFYERYKANVHVASLKENYRSQPVILEAASAVIKHNKERLSRYIPEITEDLMPMSGRPAQPLETHQFPSVESEDYFVTKRIEKMIEDGVSPSDIAVLYRYHRDGVELLRLMRAHHIPVRLEAGENVLHDVAIHQFLQVLAYIAQPHKEELLADILHYDWWHIPHLDVLKAVNHAGSTRQSLLAVILENKELQSAGVLKKETMQSVVDKLAHWHTKQANVPLPDVLYSVLHDSGWLDALIADDGQMATMKKLSAVLQAAKDMCNTNPAVTLQDFIQSIHVLEEYGISLEIEPWHVSDGAVRLMTAHKAKGLEFEHVFVMRLNDKHWGNNPEPAKIKLPHGLVRYDRVIADQNNEDERRLFYVALTRAKQSLVLTRSAHNEAGRPTVPSLFWQEVPLELVDTSEHQLIDGEFAAGLSMRAQFMPYISSEEVHDWLGQLLKRYTMSVTHLNNYLECPRLFYIRNFLQVPSSRTPHQAFGTAVHEALRAFFEEFRKTGTLPKKEELLTQFEWWLNRQILSHQERKDALSLGQEYLSAYVDHYRDSFVPHIHNEFDFRRHGIRLKDLPLTGKIDKLELLDTSAVNSDGTWKQGAPVKVVDYKTGNPDRGASKVRKGQPYWRQLVFYKMLTDLSPQFPYTVTAGEVDFIQPGDKGFVRKVVNVTNKDVEALKEEIGDVWKDIQAMKFLNEELACGTCDVCTGYRP